MISKEIIFYLFLCWLYLIHKCNTEKISYISTERPMVYWYDTKTFNNLTLRSKRMSRQDPRYYVELHMQPLFTISNNLKLDFFFYQYITNLRVYRASFLEMHFTFCNMLNSDVIFGAAVRTALGDKHCPLLPGTYNMVNMTIPNVPKGFPFTKGRIYCNLTLIEGTSSKPVASGSIDMEIKVAKINNKKSAKK